MGLTIRFISKALRGCELLPELDMNVPDNEPEIGALSKKK